MEDSHPAQATYLSQSAVTDSQSGVECWTGLSPAQGILIWRGHVFSFQVGRHCINVLLNLTRMINASIKRGLRMSSSFLRLHGWAALQSVLTASLALTCFPNTTKTTTFHSQAVFLSEPAPLNTGLTSACRTHLCTCLVEVNPLVSGLHSAFSTLN